MKTYRWATLGCGVIANELAQAMQKDGRTLYGVANRTYENAVAFAKKYEVEKVYCNFISSNNDSRTCSRMWKLRQCFLR